MRVSFDLYHPLDLQEAERFLAKFLTEKSAPGDTTPDTLAYGHDGGIVGHVHRNPDGDYVVKTYRDAQTFGLLR